MNPTNDLKCDSFTLVINDAMDKCIKCLSPRQRNNLVQLLTQLQIRRVHDGYNDSSIANMLNNIGKYLEQSNLSQLSLHFYLEQLRIEEFHLGRLHPDLADTFNSIGEVYASDDQYFEAAEYFQAAIFLLKANKKGGKLYSLVLYNAGLAQYHQLLLADAMENFNLSIKEKQNYLGKFHHNVAEMHLNVGKLLLEMGRIDAAMDNFLNALVIMRMNMGNSSTVSEILYYIGLTHRINDEQTEALNSFNQSLDIVNEHYDDDICMVLILHKIGLTNQSMGDIDKAINTFEQIVNIVKDKVGEKHICVAVVLGLLRQFYTEQGMIEKSKEVTVEITAICLDTNKHNMYCSRNEFAEFVITLFGYIVEDNSASAAAAA